MRGAAEAVKPDGRTGADFGALDRAKADYPRAQKRRCGLVTEPVRDRVGEILAHHDELGIAAIVIVTREPGVQAEIFAAAPAIRALAAGLAKPCDTDTRARAGKTRAFGAASDDRSDDLVAGNDSRMARRQVALGDVEVGAANAAGLDTDENLARARFGVRKLDRAQRIGFDRGGRVYSHRFHDIVIIDARSRNGLSRVFGLLPRF